MAKLNRIRIINFYYNNDIRQIPDQILSLFGGENALFNLANGGGKSVMIQLMMQPVIPDYTIQKRSMSSYFKKNTQPAYIMLEWILDNPSKKDYLLTGIAMTQKNTGEENGNNKLNYFTFVSHYSEACELDLGCLPFFKKEEGKQVIMPFEEARSVVKNMANKNSEIFYYGKDDAVAYRKKLNEFRISQEEWKNIIAKMNNDEGGIDELFEKCSTSNKLIDEWVIKTVEKAVIAEDTENTQVYELMEELVNTTIRNEEHIKNRKNLIAYLSDHLELEQSLNEVCNKIEEYDYGRNDLNHLYSLLKIESERIQADLTEIDFLKNEYDEKLHTIDREQKSEEYYNCQERYLELEDDENELKTKKEMIHQFMSEIKRKHNIQNAAKYNEKVQEIRGAINGIQVKIQAYENQDNSEQQRIINLKYSLKLSYQKWAEVLNEELIKISFFVKELEDKIIQQKEEEENKQKKQNEIEKTMGSVETRVSDFLLFQDKVYKKIGISFSRNLFGVIDEKQILNQKTKMEKVQKEIIDSILLLNARIDEIKAAQTANQVEKEGIIKDIVELNYQERDKNSQEKEYFQKEKVSKGIMERYDLPQELLFEEQEIQLRMNAIIVGLEKRNTGVEVELDQLNGMIKAINCGCVYFPETLSKILETQKINFQTGEMYLNELSPEKRKMQLERNGLLAFGIIVASSEIRKLEKVKFEDAFLRQIIPVFTYEDLNFNFLEENSMVKMDNGLRIVSSYENKLFNEEDKKNYLFKLENRKIELEEKIHIIKEELNSSRLNEKCLLDFNYTYDYLDKLTKEIELIGRDMDKKDKRKTEIEMEIINLSKEEGEKSLELDDTKNTLNLQKGNIELFQEFSTRDAEYVEYLLIRGKLIQEQAEIVKALELCKQNLYLFQEKQKEVVIKKINISNESTENQKKLVEYGNALEGEIIDGTIELLENEYKKLSEGMEQSLKTLENELREKEGYLEENSLLRDSFGIEDEDYNKVRFDEKELELLNQKKNECEIEEKEISDKWLKVHDKVTRAEEQTKTALRGLSDVGLEQPLLKNQIMQDYDHRQKKIKSEKNELEEKAKECHKRSKLCEMKAEIIANRINPEVDKNNRSKFDLNQDINKQFEDLQNHFNEAEKSCISEKKKYLRIYEKITKQYDQVHESITNILNALNSLDIESEVSYETVYYYYEEAVKKRESLNKMLSYYEQQLSKMEDTKRQVIENCLSFSQSIFEGIKSISEKSRIKLNGKNRSTQMLKIGIPSEVDNKAAQSRMKDYIEETMKLLIDYMKKEQGKDGGKDKKYKERIRSMVSTRQLINQLIGKDQIPVSIYKIELNEHNSGFKSWEDAMKENSGGEKFVSFFTVASTLISYTRQETSRKIGDSLSNESKVMIMDNPFARTSSAHLLKAVIDIARTFNIQLICLSDLSQSSITNRFSLVYMLSVRQKLYSEKEVLYVEKQQINNNGVQEDERLEHVMLHQKFEQGNLFDLIEDE